jgi:hypothetical protein
LPPQIFNRLIQDTITLAETLRRTTTFDRAAADTVGVAEAMVRVVDFSRILEETIDTFDRLFAIGPRLRGTGIDYDSDGAPIDPTNAEPPFILPEEE